MPAALPLDGLAGCQTAPVPDDELTRVKALLSRVEDGEGAPGTLLDVDLLISCGAGAVRLLQVQREGKQAQDAATFLRGFPLAAGTVLG